MAQLSAPFSRDRRALVTGGASGLGLGTARRLRELGRGRRRRRPDPAIAGDVGRDRADLTPPADRRDQRSVGRGRRRAAVDALGGLDTLVNSAGVFQFRALEDISTREWDASST